MAGHVVIAIHRVHSLETNRAEPISRQILVLSEHNLLALKKGKLEIYLYCTVKAWIIPTLCPFLAVPVCDCVISWPYSILFETIILVDENTIVLHTIEL